jgi:hypothetical protein
MRTAGMTTRDALASMGPMPAVVEQGLHIDSRDILRRTAEATGGAVGYVEKVQEALEAALAGDRDLFVSKMAEARVLAGSTMDGQIVLLETLRQSLPLPTHKSMIDIRLAIERSIRAVGVTDFQAGTSELAARFRAEAVNARTAAQQLRANWKRDSVNLRAAVARLGDPRRTALFASLDKGFEDIAAAGERAAAALDGTPAGAISEEEGMRIVQELVASELVILEAARAFAVAASQIG